jgi:hypothetical protein
MVGPAKQCQVVEGEDVRFRAAGRLDLARYRWNPRARR